MYRIETNEFEHGLNFFQKLVLKFKAKPGMKDETIAEFTGLDAKLVGIVASELHSKGLLNEYGSLNEKGKEKLLEVDGLIINSGKRKIGYTFKFTNQDKLYPYYINQVFPADLIDNAKDQHPKIVTGTKGDGDDYTDLPFFLDEALKSKENYNRPSEREVLQLVQNTNRKGIQSETDESKIEKLSAQLSIRFLNDQPEIVWACTYVYLYQNDDQTYEPDWRILDPFGFGDNVALKFYINNQANKNLLESIQRRFADAKTLGGKILSDYQEQVNKLIEERLLSDFSMGFNSLDKNLQMYLETIIKNLILLENHSYNNLDASVSFSLNLQNALENILKQDKERRISFYELVYSDLDNDLSKKKNGLIGIYRQRLFSSNTLVPQPLLNVSKSSLLRGTSLLSYLASFVLTYNYDNKSVLFNILKDRIELFIEVAQLRNEKGHGQTSSEKALKSLTKEDVQKFYGFIKSFLNDYIQNN
ncbi:hypothetical protein [Aquiflexum gelatinilyticum]|uniref:hypothetical protein n=1 Tax=Aquiflexum gelatinilyticum TaxID=2961943 RepID=UPI002167D710|nr:hypothetical protein [Aquiflexum gelatinilyticum]MCS4432849.1 hypothetical protein [Aquiflexum gelatinilyticum]